ncbi:FadR family transcriptional regulator [Micromonospora sp. DR5-3]|uniref:FadR/GntR family transcriptional regulator n=1 Tax=unclassified Micromonospora TaxID=2617518 RepID=UPI001CA3398B|nr:MULTISPECIES: FadR/GntR family transcriptional regulator [unclassified Micromonospora]MCW3816019.1 FadR family transcriptional regulator [Micromonospora sp. DR5-3]
MTGPDLPSLGAQQSAATGGYRPGYEIAAERILEYIVRERLQPGARLPTEKDLAEAVQMSRTVVREAVKILSALGRISVQKGRGIYVAEPDSALWRESFSQFLPADLKQVDEMFEFRRFAEVATSRMAAQRATPTQVKALRETAEQTADAAAHHDIEAFSRADEAFHGAVGVAASNMFFSASVDAVQRLQRQVSAIGLAGAASGSLVVAARQHLAIAEAIAAGDEEQAVVLMAEHIDTTLQQFKREIRHRLFSI